MSGSAGWQLTASTLSMTFDAGAHWTTTPLPSGVPSRRVGAVSAVADRGVWITVAGRRAVAVYRKSPGDNRWQQTAVDARPGVYLGGARLRVSVWPGPHHVLALAVTWGLTGSSAINHVYVSTDDGAHFGSAQDGPVRGYVSDLAFADAAHGVVVGGPTGADWQLFRTDTGGAAWSPVSISSSSIRPGLAEIGHAVDAGTTVHLPITVTAARSGAQRMTIYTSTDSGRTFTPSAPRPLVISPERDAGLEPVAMHGADVWVPVRGEIFESSDLGQHWVSVRTETQPVELGLVDATHAIGRAVESGCRHFKSDCYEHEYLVATSDGGRTWRPV